MKPINWIIIIGIFTTTVWIGLAITLIVLAYIEIFGF